MKVYCKLVRDKIPEQIEAEHETEVLLPGEYALHLDRKLEEEVAEYLESGDVEELIDIVEVVMAIYQNMDISDIDFIKMRLEKKGKKGGFEDRILLKWVDNG